MEQTKNRTNRRILQQLIRTRYNNNNIYICDSLPLKTSKLLQTQFTAVALLAEGQVLKNGAT
jgi:hypothetical protein